MLTWCPCGMKKRKKEKRTIACYKRICIMHDKQQELGTSHLAQQIENQWR